MTHVESVVCLSRKNVEWDFRNARRDEAQAVLSLYQRARSNEFCTWNDSYPGMGEIEADIETNNLYVLTHESKIVGAISIVPKNELDAFDCWTCKEGKEIARVVIDEEYQGNGLSYEMLEKLILILCEKGCVSVRLSVVKTNLPAYKTYIKAGFTTVAEAQMYGNSYYLMERVLDANFHADELNDEMSIC